MTMTMPHGPYDCGPDDRATGSLDWSGCLDLASDEIVEALHVLRPGNGSAERKLRLEAIARAKDALERAESQLLSVGVVI